MSKTSKVAITNINCSLYQIFYLKTNSTKVINNLYFYKTIRNKFICNNFCKQKL